MATLLNATFATDLSGFDAGDRNGGEGVSFANGFLVIAAGVTAAVPFTPLAQASGQSLRADFWVKINDTDVTEDGSNYTKDTYIYVLPTDGAVSSANSCASVALSRNVPDWGASTKHVSLNYRTSSAYTQEVPRLPRGCWIKLGIVVHTATRTWDLYVGDRLWRRAITAGNASYSDVARFAITNAASAPDTHFDSVVIDDNWSIPTESTLISDDFITSAGEIEDTKPTDNRNRYAQKWLIPTNANTGGFTRGANGAAPDASKVCQAYVRAVSDGIIVARFKASAADDHYGGIRFRCWEGSGDGIVAGAQNALFRYYSASGTPMLLQMYGQTCQSGALPITIDDGDEYELRVEMRGRYVKCQIRNVTDAGSFTNAFSSEWHLAYTDATGAGALIGEENCGVLVATSIAGVGTDNYCKSFTFTGSLPVSRDTVDIGDYEATMDHSYVGELYFTEAGDAEANLLWSKGFQFVHRAQNEAAMLAAIEHGHVYDTDNLQSYRQRSVIMCEDEYGGHGECYVTFSRRGIWVADRVTVLGGNNRSINCDNDFRPRYLLSNNYRTVGASGAVSDLAHTVEHDWRNDGTDALPHAIQVLGSFGSGNPVRITWTNGSLQNFTSANAYRGHKCILNGAPISIGAPILEYVYLTEGTVYEVYRAYLLECASGIALNNNVLTDFRDDIDNEATLDFTGGKGSAKTNATGDANTDGFNERYGWYEVTCDGNGEASFELQPGSYTRYQPQFRLWSWDSSATEINIGGSVATAGTDYVLDDLGDGSALLQILSDISSDTVISVEVLPSEGYAAISAVATLAATGYQLPTGSVDLSATPSLAATGETPGVMPEGYAVLIATPTLAVAGYQLPTGDCDLSAVATLAATGEAPAIEGDAVYPDASDVRSGVQYGPNGDDYTGTLVVGAGTYFPGLLF